MEETGKHTNFIYGEWAPSADQMPTMSCVYVTESTEGKTRWWWLSSAFKNHSHGRWWAISYARLLAVSCFDKKPINIPSNT